MAKFEQGAIRLVVTAATDPDDLIWDHVRAHGDGVRVLSFAVLDVERAYTAAVERSGLADTRLVAPFLKTIVGTDTYIDELW